MEKHVTARNGLSEAASQKREVLIVVMEPVQATDLSLLTDTFHEATAVSSPQAGYSICVVAGHGGPTVSSSSGLEMYTSSPYASYRQHADTVLVVGCHGHAEFACDQSFTSWFREQSSRCRRIGSFSGGTFLLAQLGLLDGKQIAIHWKDHDLLAERYPRVKADPGPLYTRDQKVYTCAGSMASVDLALAMIEEDLGPVVAADVARSMLLYARRPGAAPQLSAALLAQTQELSPIAKLLSWLPANLEHDLSIRLLARRVAMSPRNFARLFRLEVGTTPARHIESLRLDAACMHLGSTPMTVEKVAALTGFRTTETLRRTFLRRLGTTPGNYRKSSSGRGSRAGSLHASAGAREMAAK